VAVPLVAAPEPVPVPLAAVIVPAARVERVAPVPEPAPMPMVLGDEGAGVVAAVGPGVTVVKPGDHVIIFIPDKRLLRAVEKLFQVSATFF